MPTKSPPSAATVAVCLVGISLFVVAGKTVAYGVNRTARTGRSSQLDAATANALETARKKVELVGERCERGGTILDEKAMIELQNFPIEPDELIAKARYALKKDSGVLEPSLWAEDFEFYAPFVGPLNKERFLEAANGFNIYEAFPDFDNRYFGFTVDPLEPGRVWFFVRLVATNEGGIFGKKPNHKTVEVSPQVFSMRFREDGKITELTVGYSIDRRQGDTEGLGGMFGLFYGIGQPLPFPEGKPYRTSLRFRLLNAIGDFVSGMRKK